MKYMTDRVKKCRDAWRKTNTILATEVFRQASGMMSAGGSVCQIHDRPREEMPRCMAEN